MTRKPAKSKAPTPRTVTYVWRMSVAKYIGVTREERQWSVLLRVESADFGAATAAALAYVAERRCLYVFADARITALEYVGVLHG